MNRLIAQRDEAKATGLEKVASQLSEQIGTIGTREDASEYVYNYSELKSDVQSSLWDAAIRAQDFYGKLADAAQIQELIEKQSEDFINSIRVQAGAITGAYEASLPGQEDVAIEVSEDD